jgi:hypothetical protein
MSDPAPSLAVLVAVVILVGFWAAVMMVLRG